MKGFYNKILNIDLDTRRFWIEEISDDILEAVLGGRGLGAYLLWKNLKKDTVPLSPANVLIFTVGPTTGTKMMGASRYGVFTKSPQTHFFADSYSGGYVAPQIKRCGYDAIIIREVSDRDIKFHSARHLRGKDTYETENKVLKEVALLQKVW